MVSTQHKLVGYGKGMMERVDILMNNFVLMGKTGLSYIMVDDDKNNQQPSAESNKDLNIGTDADINVGKDSDDKT